MGTLLKRFIHFAMPITNFFDGIGKDKVALKRGCIVYIDLVFGRAQHSGVYVGNGKIIELNGDGMVRKISAEKFLAGDGGLTRTALTIFAACDNYGKVLHSNNIANRAESQVGKRLNYELVLENCHKFTTGCITGNFKNDCTFFTELESTIEDRLNNGNDIDWFPS